MEAVRRALESDLCQPGDFFLSRMLGFEFSYPEDRCEVGFTVRDFMFNPRGSLHGGIIALAMDASMGHLLIHRGQHAATLELKTQFLRPVSSGPVRTIGRLLRQGSSVSFMQSEFIGHDGELSAFATATWKCRR